MVTRSTILVIFWEERVVRITNLPVPVQPTLPPLLLLELLPEAGNGLRDPPIVLVSVKQTMEGDSNVCSPLPREEGGS